MRQSLALVLKASEPVSHAARQPWAPGVRHAVKRRRVSRAHGLLELTARKPRALEEAERPRRVRLEVVPVAKHLTEPIHRQLDCAPILVVYHRHPLAVAVHRRALGMGRAQIRLCLSQVAPQDVQARMTHKPLQRYQVNAAPEGQ